MTYAPTTTTKEAKLLRTLAADGATLVDAANAMDWDFQRVQYWEQRLDIRFKRGRRPAAVPPADEAKLRKFANAGLTINDTADRMGWNPRKVWYWESRLGLQFVREKQRKAKT